MTRRTAWRLALFGAGVYLLFAVMTFPAGVALDLFLPDGVSAQSVRGSLWNGEAHAVRAGTLAVRRLTWDTHPLSLLAGRVSATIDAELADGKVQGRVGAAILGDALFGKELRGVLPLAALREALPLKGIAGRLWVRLDRIRIEDGWPSELTGTATLDGLQVSLPETVEIGSFEIDLGRRDDGTLVGEFRDAEAALETTGSVIIVRGQYRIEGRARPTGPGPVADTLKFLGTPDAEGFYPLRLEGSF
jgi:hypothetical protein